MDLISVILPVYNCEKWVERCIKSILNQTYKNIELIIINDGSTDNTLEVCKKYENNQVTIINKENTGVSKTRNVGLEKAQGEYVFFIDADDYIQEECIENMYEKAKEYDTDIVKCDYMQFDDNGKIEKEALFKEEFLYDMKDELQKSTLLNEMIDTYKFNNVWGQLILAKKAKKIKFDENLAMGEDFLYNYELFNICNKILVVPDQYYCYYLNKNGMNFNESISKIQRKIEDTVYFYKEILDNNNGISEKLILKNAIKEIVLHIVMISTNNEISKQQKKKYLKNILEDDRFRKIQQDLKLNDIDFENKRYRLAGKFILNREYGKLYMYLQYIYNPMKKIKLRIKMG